MFTEQGALARIWKYLFHWQGSKRLDKRVINDNGWAWARVRGGDSLGYRRGRGQNRGLMSDLTIRGYLWF